MHHSSVFRILFSGFFVLSILIVHPLQAQDESMGLLQPLPHEEGHWTLSVSSNYVSHPEADPRLAFGMDASIFMGKHVSLNANMAFGRGYFQGGVAIIGLPFLLLGISEDGIGDGSLEDFLIGLALIALTFENMKFHIPLSPNLEISPYFSLLRIKYIEGGYGGSENDTQANLVLGGSLNFYTGERFFLSLYTEANRNWAGGALLGWNSGLHLGVYFYGR
jgi:hypothetical protein